MKTIFPKTSITSCCPKSLNGFQIDCIMRAFISELQRGEPVSCAGARFEIIYGNFNLLPRFQILNVLQQGIIVRQAWVCLINIARLTIIHIQCRKRGDILQYYLQIETAIVHKSQDKPDQMILEHNFWVGGRGSVKR